MPELEGAVAEPAESSVSLEQGNSVEESSQSTGEVEQQGTEGAVETETEAKPTGKFDASSLIKDPAKRESLKALDPALPGFIRDAVFQRKQIDAAGG